MRAELAMLAYKAWRESRTRFVLGALVLAAVCALFVVFHAEFRRLMGAPGAPASSYGGYIYLRIYESVGRAMFWLIAIVLGLGGLWRERAHGTIGFTLALPVHRWHHAVARAAVGVLQVGTLALVPALIVPACSRLVGASYPWAQALGFALIWAAAGGVVFAFAFAISVVIRSDYVALAVAVLGMRLAASALPRLPGLADADLRRIMTGRGMAYFDATRAQLIATPWLTAAATALVAIAMIALAVRITARQRFHEP
jgi:ABC-type transport system involved in multi-copper enzyme maturation permease subunit